MIKIASFFAGVGGIDLAFENAGFSVVYANEIDPYPAETYNLNFKIKVDTRDISKVSASEIPDFDVMVGGFPCQAFSIAGAREGFGDKKGRGTLFFEMIRIIKEKEVLGKKPQALFFENVKNLQTHDKGNTFKVILETLKELGYHTHYKVLNAKDYGNIPQNRERIYIVAFLYKKVLDKFSFVDILPIDRTIKIKDIVDNAKLSSHLYYDESF